MEHRCRLTRGHSGSSLAETGASAEAASSRCSGVALTPAHCSLSCGQECGSFLPVAISVRDSFCPRITSSAVGLGWLNGDRFVLLVTLQPLLFLVQQLQALPLACGCSQGFGECCPFSSGSFLLAQVVCPWLEPGWSSRVPSRRAGRDREWGQGELACGGAEELQVLGFPGAPILQGSRAGPRALRCRRTDLAELPPMASLRSHRRRDGVS